MQLYLLLLSIVLLGACLVDAKKMWGSRKKRDEVLEETVPAVAKTVYKPSSSKRGVTSRNKFNIDSTGDGLDGDNLASMFTKYLNTFEELVDSADFDAIDPALVRQFVDQIPEAAQIPEVVAMLSMIESADSNTLRAMVKEGINSVKSSTNEIVALLTDPKQIEALLAQLPSEIREIVRGLQSGDTSALKDYIMNQPGLEHSQKSLLMSLLDGNTDVLTRELKKALSDNSQVEATRLQMLEHPEMVEAFGVSQEVLHDSTKWAAMMAESADTLIDQLDSGEEASEVEALKAQFKSRRSVLDSEDEQVQDLLKKLKSKMGRAG